MTRAPRVDPEVENATPRGDGITQIRLPMRGNPLRYVNAYAIEDEGGLTLLDCGWKSDDVLAALNDGLASLGAGVADVRRLVVTHFHHDHYGLAATLRRLGVPALMLHSRDWRIAEYIFRDPAGAERVADDWLQRNGYTVKSDVEDEAYGRRSERAEPTALLSDGEHVGRLRAVWTPGHSPGHLCLRDAVTNALFSGDHVLDPVTPHVGMWFEDRGDPLGDYLDSLRKAGGMGATRVFPAHGEPFDDLGGRVRELLAHHAVREALVVDALRAGPKTAAHVAQALPWTRRARTFDALDETHRQFAVAETIAHLQHAHAVRAVDRYDDGARIVYEASR